MLIEFRVKNYRSFRENQALSMVAGAVAEDLVKKAGDRAPRGALL